MGRTVGFEFLDKPRPPAVAADPARALRSRELTRYLLDIGVAGNAPDKQIQNKRSEKTRHILAGKYVEFIRRTPQMSID